jgi:cytochrome c oxidase cbb3-type subunit 1
MGEAERIQQQDGIRPCDATMQAFALAALIWGGGGLGLLAAGAVSAAVTGAEGPAVVSPAALLTAAFLNLFVAAVLRMRRGGEVCPWRGAVWTVFWLLQVLAAANIIESLLPADLRTNYATEMWLGILWPLTLAAYAVVLIRVHGGTPPPASWFPIGGIIILAISGVASILAANPPAACSANPICTQVEVFLIQWFAGQDTQTLALIAGFWGIASHFAGERTGRPSAFCWLSAVHFAGILLAFAVAATPHDALVLMAPLALAALAAVLVLAGGKLIKDGAVRLLVLGLVFYAFSFGAWILIRINPPQPVNSLSHYTDWTLRAAYTDVLGLPLAVYSGALSIMAAAAADGRLWSPRLVKCQFWLCASGWLLLTGSMWLSGITQQLMWSVYDKAGFLDYSFAETASALKPYLIFRAVAAVLLLLGWVVLVYTVFRARTARTE